jgi:polysaccharide export outer membrane protein
MIRKCLAYGVAILMLPLAVGCSSTVEPINLPDLSPNKELQEQFNVELSPLTFEKAKELNSQVYKRFVSRPGRSFSAAVVTESEIVSDIPTFSFEKPTYRLGVGDTLSFTQFIEKSTSLGGAGLITDFSKLSSSENSPQNLTASSTNIISTIGRVGTDGSLLLIGVGRLEAAGREISQLRNEVRSILIRNGKAPDFQLEIDGFNSQKAFVTKDSPLIEDSDQSSFVMPITDQGITLRQVIAGAGIAFNERNLTLINIQRDGQTFKFTLSDIFSEKSQEIFIKDKDHIFIKSLKYLDGKVFLLGGVAPTVVSIKPEERQSLADVLFSPRGPLEVQTAQRSAVYLLRGNDPIRAYHLDVQNPARILVANEVELRPNDVVFTAEQPISVFNRVLATILPLRILSRDVENNNIP